MTRTVTATEARARLFALLDELDAHGIEITRRGRVVARLEPATPGKRLKNFLKGAGLHERH
jgi:prevent-host-death family protein